MTTAREIPVESPVTRNVNSAMPRGSASSRYAMRPYRRGSRIWRRCPFAAPRLRRARGRGHADSPRGPGAGSRTTERGDLRGCEHAGMHRAASPSLGAATTLALLVLVSATGGPFGDRLGERAVDGRPHAQPARAPAFPPRSAVAQARRYLAHRGGSVSFALIDSRGRLYGYAPRRRYVSASVTKAMMLVAYLRAIGRPPPERRGESRARADDHALRQRPRRHRVPLGRGCTAAQPGRACGHEVVLGVRLLGLRADHRRGPGPLLPAHRPAGAAGATGPTRAGSSPRSCPGSGGGSPAPRAGRASGSS